MGSRAARGRRLPARGWRVEHRPAVGKLGFWSKFVSEYNGLGGEMNRGRFLLRFDKGRENERFTTEADFRDNAEADFNGLMQRLI